MTGVQGLELPTNEEHFDRQMVTEWLNDAALASSAVEKVELVRKIQEIVIHKAPELLVDLLADVLSFASDRSGDVKKCLVGFIEEACKHNEAILPRVVVNLHMLLCDESVQVQKRVIQATTSIYRTMLNWLCKASFVTEEMEQAWTQLNAIKVEIVNMIDSDNDGIRTHSIKFLEGVVLLQTYPEPGTPRKENDFSLEDVPLTLKIARRRKLEEEAKHIFALLLKFHNSPHISSVNLMACMGSLCTIAKSRPEFMSEVVTSLESLQANLPPTLTHSQVSSVRKHLKLQLLNLLKHPASAEVYMSIVNLLAELGGNTQEIMRAYPLPAERRRVLKRTADVAPLNGTSVNKKARTDENDSESAKHQANELNMAFIQENLDLDMSVQLIFLGMQHLPSTMPGTFAVDYSSVSSSGVSASIKSISNLLSKQFTEVGVGPGADIFSKGVEADVGSKDVRETDVYEEKQTRKERVVKPRVRTLKLSEITKPLSESVRDRMLVSAVYRVLNFERNSADDNVSNIRNKIITTVAATFSISVRKTVLNFLLSDLRSHINIALSWLYEEYSFMQGFSRMPSILRREVKPGHSYNMLLCDLISSLETDRDGLLSRIYFEAPLVTDDAVELLRKMAENRMRYAGAVNLIKDLVLRRPPKRSVFLNLILALTVHENAAVREDAIEKVLVLHKHPELQKTIEDHAMKYLEYLQLSEPPDVILRTGSEIWNDDLIRMCLYLYLALLPLKESLIHKLAKVYTQTNADTKRIILRLVEQPVRGMGVDSPELLELLEQCPKGAETLVTRVIHILTDRGPPSVQLVAKVRDLYHTRVSDVRFIIPVLNGLTKKEVIAALPKLIKLNPVVVKEVFNRLLGMHGDSPITPAELLISLHLIDSQKVEIKTVMKATSLCFAEKHIYTQEVLAVVIQQLMDISPPPTLLMRTVIQSLGLYPRLSGFVMNILQRLISKQVWRYRVVWDGFVKCCQRTRPQSFQVLLQLPPAQLAEALNTCPELRKPIQEHVQSFTEAQRSHIPASILEVIMTRPNVMSPVMPVEVKLEPVDVGFAEPLPPGME